MDCDHLNGRVTVTGQEFMDCNHLSCRATVTGHTFNFGNWMRTGAFNVEWLLAMRTTSTGRNKESTQTHRAVPAWCYKTLFILTGSNTA